ncbi:MAG: Ig-like domain-containing protein [Ruminococcus sp.]|nr:Ig-like domain-containing protein [Ruminococcus sp.]
MYEEKSRKLNINWKSFLIKMIILLVAVFIILWLISLINKKNSDKPSNLNTNLKLMQQAATEYFTESKLPTTINGKKKITLQEMFDSKLLVEFKDQNNKACDTTESYAETTKKNSTSYDLKVKLVCANEANYIMDQITLANKDDDNTTNIDNPDNNDNNNTIVDNTPVDNNNNTTNNNNSSSTNKPANTSTSTSNNSTTTTKPNNNSNTATTNKPTTTTCSYGNKDYINYTLSYEIPGNCAVSKSDYNKADYINAVNSVTATEYQKIVTEMSSYSNIYIENPNFTGVYNKTNTGLVGYQILFTVKRKNNYALETVYQYYLNKDGSRKVILDKRSSLNKTPSNSTTTNNNNNSTNNSVINATKVTLNKTSLSLTTGDTYRLTASLTPSNATSSTSWTSSDTSVATVSNGLVTAKNPGSTTITAKSGNAYSSITVTVSPKTIGVNSVTINDGNLDLYIGDTHYLNVTVKPNNATNKNVTYTSSMPNVASVDSNGKITARKVGYTTITASSNGYSSSIRVSVTTEPTYKYCKRTYQTDYIIASELPNSYSSKNLTIKYSNKNMKDVQVYSAGYLYDNDDTYRNARNYLYNPRIYLVQDYGISNYTVPINYQLFSLKQANFWQNITQTYEKNGYWYIDVSYRVNNYNNVSPYTYNYSTKTYVYYIPLYFSIEYTDLNDCVNLKKGEESKYSNYRKVS